MEKKGNVIHPELHQMSTTNMLAVYQKSTFIISMILNGINCWVFLNHSVNTGFCKTACILFAGWMAGVVHPSFMYLSSSDICRSFCASFAEKWRN